VRYRLVESSLTKYLLALGAIMLFGRVHQRDRPDKLTKILEAILEK
jgi:hypothetical protein